MNTTYRVHPRAKIASHETMIYFEHPGIRYQVLAAGTLHANKQVEQCVSQHKVGTLCSMNDMPSQALAQLVKTRASTFTAFRNGYGLREYSLTLKYCSREDPLKP